MVENNIKDIGAMDVIASLPLIGTIPESITLSDDTDSAEEVEIIAEHKANSTKHSCRLCNQGTLLVDRLMSFGGVANSVSKFSCEICEKGFETETALTVHKRMHFVGSANSKEIYRCKDCGKEYRTTTGFYKHKLTVHGHISSHLCKVCWMRFTDYKLFTQHCISHNNEKRHSVTHNNKRKHSVSYNNKNHSVPNKNEEMPYSCKNCYKKFLFKNSLLQHQCIIEESVIFPKNWIETPSGNP